MRTASHELVVKRDPGLGNTPSDLDLQIEGLVLEVQLGQFVSQVILIITGFVLCNNRLRVYDRGE